MTEPTPEQVKLSRAKLLTLMAIAFVPIFISILAFQFFPEWRPDGTTNRGELIMPPVQAGDISEDLMRYEGWVLLQPVTGQCDTDCQQMIYLSRQVVIALGREAGRVERALIAPNGIDAGLQQLISQEHADLSVLSVDRSRLDQVSAQSPLLFLMDPNGNIMMYFTLEKAGKPMLKDIKHLLKLSNIG